MTAPSTNTTTPPQAPLSQDQNQDQDKDQDPELYQLTFYVPQTHTQQCLDALFAVGAGTWPNPKPKPDDSASTSTPSSTSTSDTNSNPDPNSNLEPSSSPDIPKYINTCFITAGTGQFQPTQTANPHIGTAGGQIEYVREDRVEMVIWGDKGVVKRAVEALRRAHPYEVVAFFVVKSESLGFF